MKNPLPLSNMWNRPDNKDPQQVSVPSTNKKFKRKSREPKRFFNGPEPDRMNTYTVDVTDADWVDDAHMESHNVHKLAPLKRHLMMSQEPMASTTGILSGLKEDMAAAQSGGAIDMRIGSNVPVDASKVSQVPTSSFSNPEISHWPTSISQPLSSRLKLGLQSIFPPSTSTCNSASHQVFSLEAPPGQSAARVSQSSECHEHMDPQVPSHKESLRKRIGLSPDGSGHLPEVKAIQQTRRLLANARERTRVHTISAAFEALRKQVPCYSYGQKLSKLAILRIACNYILSLAQLAELDYSSDHSSVSFSQCVEQCTRTLQAEGRSKKRKVGRMPEDV
ncbi:transcription factor atoh8 [Maylandia zebra]|uniref:Protein atonal homolog 8 n=3 Tax=Haplochromini TaxID=319058 RepID=A0A3Q2UWC3_HAPBU|nr:protein atonal homolog 8 [Maylandia zebra]XP_005944967.1 protein atonal homolog 8 [Haplochromis burtoni]XP_024659635.1 protein atonal homolog 8 [Maylandia zebra]XP_026037491.1 protein atonal homolog 8 [Astatotilapia calliptera]